MHRLRSILSLDIKPITMQSGVSRSLSWSLKFVTLLSVLLYFVFQANTSQLREVFVDPVSGNDSSCLSNISQELRQPCKTIQKALGNMNCNCRNINQSSDVSLENIAIRLVDGVHTIDNCVGVKLGNNVSVEAVNLTGNTIIRCGRFPSSKRFETGMASCNTNGLTFRGLTFERCGPFTPNVFINHSTNVLFEDCVFRSNTGAPLQLQFVPSIVLRRTFFLNNNNQIPDEEDTVNTTISELYDSRTTSGGFTYFSRNENVHISIENCTFSNNSAGVNAVNNSRPVLLKANGHGGAVLIRLAQVQNAIIKITDSNFLNNQAEVDGGGVYFSLSEGFSSSLITLLNNRFVNNSVQESSGGAVSVNIFRLSFNNSFLIHNCIFEGNGANSGGAFGIVLYDTELDSITYPDSASFVNCYFINNFARNEGTAVGLFALVHVDEVGFPVDFADCQFENNTSVDSIAEHSSSLVTFRFPTRFEGHTCFRQNKGGGITLLNTILIVTGTMLFDGNTAQFGGAIAMDDRCLVEVRPNVNLTFINNRAEETGGAIHVIFPAIRYTTDIFNRLCFIQYSSPTGGDFPPHMWQNVTIKFINNTARLSGAAMYASDMQLCHWLGANYTSDTSIIFNNPDDSNLVSPFIYEGNTLLNSGQRDERLATAPHRVHAIPEYTLIQSGETVGIDLLVTDQLNNNREGIFSLKGPQGEDVVDGLSTDNETYLYLVPTIQSLIGEAGSCNTSHSVQVGEFSLVFSLPGTSGRVESVLLNFSGCHPGYILDTSKCMCRCDTTNDHVIRCDDSERYIYLRAGIWGGVKEGDESRQLITAGVQPSFVDCQKDGQLPGCLFSFDDPNAQCRDGRQGILCGRCADGYAVTLDLLQCVGNGNNCAVGLSVLLILCVMVTIICLLILIFNVELPNEMKGFVFYAQVIGLVYRPFIIVQTSLSGFDNALSILLNILGSSLPLPLCVSPSMRAHHVALLGYITPIIGLLIVVGYAVGAQFIKTLSNRSALKGITFLSIFIYKYMADASFILISCSDTKYGFVFQYDGSLSCTSIEFGFFTLIGFVLVLFLVAPAPFLVGYICTRRPQKFQQYADVLTKGLKVQRRWFGGWDIGRRLPFVFIGYLTVLVRPSLVLFLMVLITVAVLLVHVLTKPYEKNHVNIIETLILLNLVAVTVMFLDPTDNPVPKWLSTVLLILPYIYAIMYIAWISAVYIWNRYVSQLSFGVHLSHLIRRQRRPDMTTTTENTTDRQQGGDPNQNDTNNTMASTGSTGASKDSTNNSSDASTPQKLNVSADKFDEPCTQLREPLLDL